jgi:hypothetical protein
LTLWGKAPKFVKVTFLRANEERERSREKIVDEESRRELASAGATRLILRKFFVAE